MTCCLTSNEPKGPQRSSEVKGLIARPKPLKSTANTAQMSFHNYLRVWDIWGHAFELPSRPKLKDSAGPRNTAENGLT